VHHPVRHQRIILAMVHHRQIEHLRVLKRAPHQFVVLHTMAVVGNGDDPRLFERADGRQFLAGDVLRDGAGDKNIHHALPRRALANQRHRAALSMTGDVFGMQTTEVKPPRAAAAVPVAMVSLAVWPGSRRWTCKSSSPGKPPGRSRPGVRLGGRLAGRRPRRARRFYRLESTISNGVEMVGGVDYSPAGEEQRVSCAGSIHAGELTRQRRRYDSGAWVRA